MSGRTGEREGQHDELEFLQGDDFIERYGPKTPEEVEQVRARLMNEPPFEDGEYEEPDPPARTVEELDAQWTKNGMPAERRATMIAEVKRLGLLDPPPLRVRMSVQTGLAYLRQTFADYPPDAVKELLASWVGERDERALLATCPKLAKVVEAVDRVAHGEPLAKFPGLARAVRDLGTKAREREAARRQIEAKAVASRPWMTAEQVKPEHITWLWRGRIPFGKVTLLDGDPGQGKSTIGLDIAARLSTGRAMPGEASAEPAAGAVVISFEDGAADTIRPRLEAAGADLARVVIFRLDRTPSLPDDVPLIEQAIRETGARFVLLDPLMAALTGRVDAHRDQDIRRALRPLAVLAERTGAAILVVRHLNKNSGKGTSAMYRGGGSIGITGAARAVLVAGYDPDVPEDTSRHALAPVKMNLCAMPPTLKYTTTAVQLDGGYEAMKIEWQGESAVTADALLAQPSTKEARNKVEEVAGFLTTMLVDGPRPARELECELRDMGFSAWAIRAARRRLGIVSEHEGGERGGGRWMWSLPTDATVTNDGGMEVRVRA